MAAIWVSISDVDLGLVSLLTPGYTPRLPWAIGEIFQVNDDNSFISYFSESAPEFVTNRFPNAPGNLRREVYSDSAVELFWDRAGESGFQSDFVTGYEIYLQDQLFDQTGVVTSYFVDALDDAEAARFSVRPVRGAVAGYAASVNVDTSPTDQPTDPPTDPRIDPTANLRGTVYSSSALEIFYERSTVPGARYEITRNGEIIHAASDGNSYFDSGLQSGSEYTYAVKTIIDGVKSAASTVTLTTYGGGGISYFDANASSDSNCTYAVIAIDRQRNRSIPASFQL